VVERDGMLWCRQHDPEAEKARLEAATTRWKAEDDANRQRVAARKADADLKDAALDAIRRITDGHNDPRGLALEVLSRTGRIERGG
jgi:hypothetical protein